MFDVLAHSCGDLPASFAIVTVYIAYLEAVSIKLIALDQPSAAHVLAYKIVGVIWCIERFFNFNTVR